MTKSEKNLNPNEKKNETNQKKKSMTMTRSWKKKSLDYDDDDDVDLHYTTDDELHLIFHLLFYVEMKKEFVIETVSFHEIDLVFLPSANDCGELLFDAEILLLNQLILDYASMILVDYVKTIYVDYDYLLDYA